MKMNLKVRAKNPYFWFGLVGLILATIGVEPSMFTSWEILFDKVVEVLKNPFVVGSVVVAIIGVLNDPTTGGLSDKKEDK